MAEAVEKYRKQLLKDPLAFHRKPGETPPLAPNRERRVATIWPTGVISPLPPPEPVYHVTESGERLLVLHVTRVADCKIPELKRAHEEKERLAAHQAAFDAQRAEVLAARAEAVANGQVLPDAPLGTTLSMAELSVPPPPLAPMAPPPAAKSKSKQRRKKRKVRLLPSSRAFRVDAPVPVGRRAGRRVLRGPRAARLRRGPRRPRRRLRGP